MAKIKVTRETSIEFGADLSLNDLRAFIDTCREVAGNARVAVRQHSDQRDGTYTSMTVQEL